MRINVVGVSCYELCNRFSFTIIFSVIFTSPFTVLHKVGIVGAHSVNEIVKPDYTIRNSSQAMAEVDSLYTLSCSRM